MSIDRKPKQIEADDILIHLRQKGVTHGINERAIENLVRLLGRGSYDFFIEIIALGSREEKGAKARIELFDRIGRIEKTERGWQFARWKKQIYKRDKYICQKCKSIDNLFAHHILSWKDYPDLRFKLSNGITLCGVCHKKLHKNKTRNNPL